MQIVHYTDDKIGSFDWELPSSLANLISQLPIEGQGAIDQELKLNVQAYLLLLVGSLKMGARIQDALDLINASQLALSRKLVEMARDEVRKS